MNGKEKNFKKRESVSFFYLKEREYDKERMENNSFPLKKLVI